MQACFPIGTYITHQPQKKNNKRKENTHPEKLTISVSVTTIVSVSMVESVLAAPASVV